MAHHLHIRAIHGVDVSMRSRTELACNSRFQVPGGRLRKRSYRYRSRRACRHLPRRSDAREIDGVVHGRKHKRKKHPPQFFLFFFRRFISPG